MSKNDIEIEIKFPLTAAEYKSVRNKIKKNCKFVKKSTQTDTYFTPKHRNFMSHKYPYEWLSLRQRSAKTILNYKHWYPEGRKYTHYCDEFETEIENGEHLLKILKSLDFRLVVTVVKIREIYVSKNELEISLDDVKDLGFFIEVESLKNDVDFEAIRSKILDFTHNLGIKRTRTVPGGYAALLLKKKNLNWA